MSLPARWTALRPHPISEFAWVHPARFKVIPAGRRAYKTEKEKRKSVLAALARPGDRWYSKFPDPRYACCAPTRDQAKRIFWDDLKKLMPKSAVRNISESELTITTVLGSSISVVGMDKPERIEGSPWDGVVLDEFANMKAKAWDAHVRPALADRGGWADIIGVPEGRNHYWDLNEDAKARMIAGDPDWFSTTWTSATVLPEHEVRTARETMDELTFQQEFEASFVNFTGRTYYCFGDWNLRKLEYQPKATLCFCFDFNVDPGVAVVTQFLEVGALRGLGALGEVYIPTNSNTPAVVRKLIADWGTHEGKVYVYGDATGGARGTAQLDGSDWDIIKRMLRDHFKDRVVFKVPSSNPTERSRVNAMNSLCRSQLGTVRFFVDPVKCPKLVRDLEGVRNLEGGSGEIDKHRDKKLTHLSDAVGYQVDKEFPISGSRAAGTARVEGA